MLNQLGGKPQFVVEDDSPAAMRRRIKSIFGGSVGNLIEWYDFYVYSSFAPYFAKFFFPSNDPNVQFLNTYALFAIGFLIRPVGGFLLGAYADNKGRRAALTLSVSLMCVGSLIIGIIPSYTSIGILAPTLLLLARLLQGISLGGEYGTSATYLSEIATSRHRGFYSSFQYVTLIGGQIVASVVLLVMQTQFTGSQLEAWGWRIPFLIGAALSVYGFYLRRRLQETDDFTRANAAADEAPARNRPGVRIDHGWDARFLYLHGLHADFLGQHSQAEPR